MTIFRKRPVQRMYAQDPQVLPGGALSHDPTGGVLSQAGPVQTAANSGYGVQANGLPDAPGFMDYAKGLGSMMSLGGGPLSIASTVGNAVMDPSSLTDTRQVNIPGIGNIATSPGPLNPMLDMVGFGVLARTMGALNARNLANVIKNDPNATTVSGPGWGGAFSNGTFNGTLPGGLEASQRRGMVHEIAKQHYDRTRDNRGDRNGGLGAAGKDHAGENGTGRKDH